MTEEIQPQDYQIGETVFVRYLLGNFYAGEIVAKAVVLPELLPLWKKERPAMTEQDFIYQVDFGGIRPFSRFDIIGALPPGTFKPNPDYIRTATPARFGERLLRLPHFSPA